MNIKEATRMRIIGLCKERGITFNKLSTICGMSQSTIKHIIEARNSTTVSTIKKICDGLEITIQDFFDADVFRDLEQEIK